LEDVRSPTNKEIRLVKLLSCLDTSKTSKNKRQKPKRWAKKTLKHSHRDKNCEQRGLKKIKQNK
jgi:hypothetical protein